MKSTFQVFPFCQQCESHVQCDSCRPCNSLTQTSTQTYPRNVIQFTSRTLYRFWFFCQFWPFNLHKHSIHTNMADKQHIDSCPARPDLAPQLPHWKKNAQKNAKKLDQKLRTKNRQNKKYETKMRKKQFFFRYTTPTTITWFNAVICCYTIKHFFSMTCR